MKGMNSWRVSWERDRTLGGLAGCLRKYMKENHIHQPELADRIGVSLCTVQHWCAGHRNPKGQAEWQMIIDVVGQPARQIMFTANNTDGRT